MVSQSDATDVEDAATVAFETRSGATGTLQCGYSLREGRYDTYIGVNGAEGSIEWDPIGPTFGFDDETKLAIESTTDTWETAPRRTTTYEYAPNSGYGGAWGLEFTRQFLAAREGAADVPATLDDALVVLRVLDAVYESADADEWVEVKA